MSKTDSVYARHGAGTVKAPDYPAGVRIGKMRQAGPVRRFGRKGKHPPYPEPYSGYITEPLCVEVVSAPLEGLGLRGQHVVRIANDRLVETGPPIWRDAPLKDLDLVVALGVARMQLCDLEDNWDGEGSPAPHPKAIDAAIRRARETTRRARALKVKLPIPYLGPGPGASVDIEWKDAAVSILVNVPPPDPGRPPTVAASRVGHPTGLKAEFSPRLLCEWLLTVGADG